MPSRDESGFTLIEMLVALMVTGLVLSAMASVAITAMRAVQSDERTVRSTQLGNEVLESLQAVPYDLVGLYETEALDHFGQATFEGEDLVLLPDPADDDSREDLVPEPFWQETRDGVTYDVEVAITWVDDPDTTAAQDYKRIVVTLTWERRGEPLSARVETLQSPGPEEHPLSARVEPDIVRIHEIPDGKNDGDFKVLVVSRIPQESVSVTWTSHKGTETKSMSRVDANGYEWERAFNSNSEHFDNGETLFVVEAIATDGEREFTTIGRGLFLYDLQIRTDNVDEYVVSPDQVRVHPDTGVCDGIDIDVLVVGATSSDSVTVTHADLVLPLAVDDDRESSLGTWFEGGLSADELVVADDDTAVAFTIDVVRSADSEVLALDDSVAIDRLTQEESC